MNEALKNKWLRYFGKEGNALWRNVTIAKYGLDFVGWYPFAHGVG